MSISYTVVQQVLPTDYDKGSDFRPEVVRNIMASAGNQVQSVNTRSGRFSTGSVSYTNRHYANYLKAIEDLWSYCTLNNAACLFLDHKGYQATTQNVGTGDASTQAFQLRVAATIGAGSVYWPVKHVVHGSLTVDLHGATQSNTVRIFFDGVEQLSGWTVDNTTGIVSFTVAPGAGVVITWTGIYLKAVIFMDDVLPIRKKSSYGSIENMRLKEINA